MTVNNEPGIQEWIREQVTIISQSELSDEYLEVILNFAYEKGQLVGVQQCIEEIKSVETEIVKNEAS